MIATKGYAAQSATEELKPFNFERREVGPKDVQFEILYCGVCHSFLAWCRSEWQTPQYNISNCTSLGPTSLLSKLNGFSSSVALCAAYPLVAIICGYYLVI